ncbi:uncharacterized protein K452DRAFT_46162 [Aplosporella prunicola CBS 121167]|uniref:Ubiquitin-like protease family profile domain-containing protein n=1 Tax=Aplosporella prunicola CBS 121167 TaxID=1176127 RepID=A0A6A6BAB7_9PEZI|nr:uncharacterized protein K452DRAFT_46162 [Aplosporella prunicola CBS 121167]KAF2141149.1 hypothetical protein K452DRAFT_46162 [Aplosporella prunicola CBS 121167]
MAAETAASASDSPGDPEAVEAQSKMEDDSNVPDAVENVHKIPTTEPVDKNIDDRQIAAPPVLPAPIGQSGGKQPSNSGQASPMAEQTPTKNGSALDVSPRIKARSPPSRTSTPESSQSEGLEQEQMSAREKAIRALSENRRISRSAMCLILDAFCRRDFQVADGPYFTATKPATLTNGNGQQSEVRSIVVLPLKLKSDGHWSVFFLNTDRREIKWVGRKAGNKVSISSVSHNLDKFATNLSDKGPWKFSETYCVDDSSEEDPRVSLLYSAICCMHDAQPIEKTLFLWRRIFLATLKQAADLEEAYRVLDCKITEPQETASKKQAVTAFHDWQSRKLEFLKALRAKLDEASDLEGAVCEAFTLLENISASAREAYSDLKKQREQTSNVVRALAAADAALNPAKETSMACPRLREQFMKLLEESQKEEMRLNEDFQAWEARLKGIQVACGLVNAWSVREKKVERKLKERLRVEKERIKEIENDAKEWWKKINHETEGL